MVRSARGIRQEVLRRLDQGTSLKALIRRPDTDGMRIRIGRFSAGSVTEGHGLAVASSESWYGCGKESLEGFLRRRQ